MRLFSLQWDSPQPALSNPKPETMGPSHPFLASGYPYSGICPRQLGVPVSRSPPACRDLHGVTVLLLLPNPAWNPGVGAEGEGEDKAGMSSSSEGTGGPGTGPVSRQAD